MPTANVRTVFVRCQTTAATALTASLSIEPLVRTRNHATRSAPTSRTSAMTAAETPQPPCCATPWHGRRLRRHHPAEAWPRPATATDPVSGIGELRRAQDHSRRGALSAVDQREIQGLRRTLCQGLSLQNVLQLGMNSPRGPVITDSWVQPPATVLST